MKIEYHSPEIITVSGKRRPLDEDAVAWLMKSIGKIGLQQPITVLDKGDGALQLVAGRHRLEACRRLGREDIACTVNEGDEVAAQLWEISENLHRAELTALERAEQTSLWIDLTKAQSDAEVQPGGAQPKDQGIRKAARTLNISKDKASRAKKIDGICDDAKAAARNAGLDDNQSALLSVAARPRAEQAAHVEKIAEAKQAPPIAVDEDAADIISTYVPEMEWTRLTEGLRRVSVVELAALLEERCAAGGTIPAFLRMRRPAA